MTRSTTSGAGRRAEGGGARRTRRALLVLCASLAVALPPGAASAQREGGPAPRWVLRESPTVALWYHALATIGYEGFGPLPFYRAGYADELRRARRARGFPPTPLARDTAALRAAFGRDSAFEVLHFLPLYFAETEPAAFVAIVRAVAVGAPTGPLPPAQRAGVAALRSLLGGAGERAALARLAADLDVEWRTFYADWLARSAPTRAAALATLQHRWDTTLAPSLGGPLAAAGVPAGTVYLVPALGPEGRVVADVPPSAIAAVWWPDEDATGNAPLLAAVRELCFPVVARLPIAAAAHGDRVAAAGESARAAVRCGARLLERTAPALAAEYRETFRRAAAPTGGRVPHSFSESYRLAPATERALDAEVARLLASGAGAPR